MSVTSTALIGFSGSRSLPASARPLVAAVVRSVVAAGRGVAVGCASGGDAFALVPALLAGARVRVFAVGGPSGRGFWRFSASGLVGSAARVFGAPVVWWAGGRCGCPSCSGSGGGRCPSLVSRLRGRSLAFVRFVAGSGSGAGLVAFVSSPGSRGSFLSVRAAAAAGLPVVVFPVGFPGSRLPVLPGGGRWVPAASSGVWARGSWSKTTCWAICTSCAGNGWGVGVHQRRATATYWRSWSTRWISSARSEHCPEDGRKDLTNRRQ